MTERAPVYKTYAEWKVGYQAWLAAGRPGGRLGRPVLDDITTCPICGGARMDLELMPAFPKPGMNLCYCPPTPESPANG